MRLSIKGTSEEVSKSLIAHGIEGIFKVHKADTFGQIIEVPDRFQLQAMHWFNETIGTPPYPPGTLLFFSGPEMKP